MNNKELTGSVPERLTPENTTIVLIDHAVGFANLLGSTDVASHVNNVVGLAKTAKLFGSGLVVTNAVPGKPSGPLYPELRAVLDAHRSLNELARPTPLRTRPSRTRCVPLVGHGSPSRASRPKAACCRAFWARCATSTRCSSSSTRQQASPKRHTRSLSNAWLAPAPHR
jgi:hypothetical protein